MNERAVRVIERWGLLAGVTGVVANLLLIALYALALPGREAYDWTGPANDVIGGVVSTLAMIPVALALRELLGGGPLLNGATALAVLAMVTIAVLSLLLIARAIPFPVQGAGAGAAAVLLLVGVSLLLPAESASQYAVGGAGLLLVAPTWLAYPVWMILLSNVLRAHVAAQPRVAAATVTGGQA